MLKTVLKSVLESSCQAQISGILIRTLRIVLTPVRLCDDSVTAFPRIFQIGGILFEGCLSDLLRGRCPQILFGGYDRLHNRRC